MKVRIELNVDEYREMIRYLDALAHEWAWMRHVPHSKPYYEHLIEFVDDMRNKRKEVEQEYGVYVDRIREWD